MPYQSFKTADGDIFVGGANDRLFGILCERLGRPEWKADPRFESNNERVRNRAALEGLIEGVTAQRTTREWQERFEGSGLPFAVVNDVQDTMNHEHGRWCVDLRMKGLLICTVRARGMVQTIDHPSCGPIKVISPPVKYSKADPSIRRPPPLLGQHTDEILRDVVGLSEARIQELRDKGVVA